MSYLRNMEKKLSESTTLEVSGDLKLSTINFPKFAKNVMVSEEVNNYLRDQLDQMKCKNECLHQELSKRDSHIRQNLLKIEELTEKITNYESVYNEFTSPSQLANSKIVELSKKLREKNSEVEVYRSKCTKLENSLSELKPKPKNDHKIDKEENVINEIEEKKKLQDKLAYTTNKWIEEKNVNLQLKNDLKRANKWLQQEVGDKFETLLTLNNSNIGWRGRAQIICDLQQKNLELKEKLKMYQENSKTECANHEEPIQIKHTKKLEVLVNENLELKNHYGELKRKFDALKARSKVLETESSALKTNLTSLTKMQEESQKTITKLTSQLSYISDLKNEDLKQKDEIIKNIQQENELLKVELAKEKCVSANKSQKLTEKNEDIQLLNKRIRSSRPLSSYVRKHENPDTKIINRLEVERIRLLELTEVHNTRLQDERNSHLKVQHLLRLERQRCAKLEASLARLQLENNSSRSGYNAKVHTPKNLEFDIKDKLVLAEENIKALTTRLEIETLERKRDLQEFNKILKNCNCSDFGIKTN